MLTESESLLALNATVIFFLVSFLPSPFKVNCLCLFLFLHNFAHSAASICNFMSMLCYVMVKLRYDNSVRTFLFRFTMFRN